MPNLIYYIKIHNQQSINKKLIVNNLGPVENTHKHKQTHTKRNKGLQHSSRIAENAIHCEGNQLQIVNQFFSHTNTHTLTHNLRNLALITIAGIWPRAGLRGDTEKLCNSFGALATKRAKQKKKNRRKAFSIFHIKHSFLSYSRLSYLPPACKTAYFHCDGA